MLQGGQCLSDVFPRCGGAVIESDGGCVLVSWQDSLNSDGLVADDDGLVAGVGDHEKCDYKHTDGIRHIKDGSETIIVLRI